MCSCFLYEVLCCCFCMRCYAKVCMRCFSFVVFSKVYVLCFCCFCMRCIHRAAPSLIHLLNESPLMICFCKLKALSKLSIILKRTVYCNDMYKRLKIGKGGTYLDKDDAIIESELKTNLISLQGRFIGELPEWWRHRRSS